MAVRIRLRRVGRKHQPTFRIVVADQESPRDGRFVELLGHYYPRARGQQLELLQPAPHRIPQECYAELPLDTRVVVANNEMGSFPSDIGQLPTTRATSPMVRLLPLTRARTVPAICPGSVDWPRD